jgi:hypothetical protein
MTRRLAFPDAEDLRMKPPCNRRLASGVLLAFALGCVGPDVTTHRPREDYEGQQKRMAEIRQNVAWLIRNKVPIGTPIEQARGVLRGEGYKCQYVKEDDGREILLGERKHQLGCGWAPCMVRVKLYHNDQRVSDTAIDVVSLDKGHELAAPK